LSASTLGAVPTARKPSTLLDTLAVIAEKGDAVESLARDAYEISFSSRRVGAEKVRGGYTPDATGERASCECGGEHPVTGELIGGRDAETGRIIHICSPYRYKRAGGNVVQAMRALTDAVNDLQAIVFGSDHHREGPFEHRDRQTIGDDDYNPAAMRAVHERARRIADEMAESYHRRLVASGVDKSQARALAERMRRSVT